MKKHGIILLVIILLFSAGFNFYQFGEIRKAESQLTIVNNRVLDNIEQYTRWSIQFIDELQGLRESGSTDDFMRKTNFRHLQSSLDDLVEYYAYFVDLRNEEMGTDGICTETLESLRSIRNVVNHNLSEKFEMNQYDFTANDYVFLQEFEDILQGFLSNVYRIAEANENQLVIEISEEQQEDLRQISTNLTELGSRYRHSILSENQEDLLSDEEARNRLTKLAGNWLEDEALEDLEIEGVQYRNGISHYALENEELLLWLGAKEGELRYFEYSLGDSELSGEEIRRNEALKIAKDFYKDFQGNALEELIEEVFTYNEEGNGELVYAFRFTPLKNNLRLSSDAFEINVGARSRKVVRFRNRFNETSVPMDVRTTLTTLDFTNAEDEVFPMSPESIEEVHKEQFPNMDYQGRAVIRNYFTEFQPRVVKVFFHEIDGQRAALYFDEFTGRELERTYYPYKSF